MKITNIFAALALTIGSPVFSVASTAFSWASYDESTVDYLVPGHYSSSNNLLWEPATIAIQPGFNDIIFTGFYYNMGEQGYRQSWDGSNEVTLTWDAKNKRFHGVVPMVHWRNHCRWDYEIEIVPQADQLYIREKFPAASYGNGRHCSFDGFDWMYHQKPYQIAASETSQLYKASADHAKSPAEKGAFSLLYAAITGDVTSIESFLKTVDPNVRDWSGRTPYLVALWNGQLEAATALYAVSDADAKDKNSKGAIYYAFSAAPVASKKDVKQFVDFVLNARPSAENYDSALSFAVRFDMIDYASSLLSGSRVSAQGRAYGIKELTKKAYGAKKIDEKWYPVLNQLISFESDKLLAPRGELLNYAIANNDIAIVNEVLKYKIDFEQRNLEDLTSLAIAISKGNIELANRLMTLGANQKALVTSKRRSLLHVAALINDQYSMSSVMATLIKNGVDPNIADTEGLTALDGLAVTIYNATKGFTSLEHNDKNRYLIQTYLWLRGAGGKQGKGVVPPDWILGMP